jgi:hypothetical protein
MTITTKLIGRLRKVRATVTKRISDYVSKEPKREVIRIQSMYDTEQRAVDIILNDGMLMEQCYLARMDCTPNIDPSGYSYNPKGGQLTLVFYFNDMKKVRS